MLVKRSAYENGIVALHDRTVEGLGRARVTWRKDEAKAKILSNLSASGGGRETVQNEAQAWESVWEKFDAAWNPSPLNTIVASRTLISDSDAQENLSKKAHTDWGTGADELLVLSNTLWDDCVAWYEAATTLFKEGTAIGDMVRSTIPTSPTTPAPAALEIAMATAVAGSLVATTYTPGGGAHATVNEAGQTVATVGAVGSDGKRAHALHEQHGPDLQHGEDGDAGVSAGQGGASARTQGAWHSKAPEEVLQSVGSNPTGLTTQEAATCLAQFGPNELTEATPISPLQIFLGQFKSLIVWILIVARVISGLLGETVDCIAILAI